MQAGGSGRLAGTFAVLTVLWLIRGRAGGRTDASLPAVSPFSPPRLRFLGTTGLAGLTGLTGLVMGCLCMPVTLVFVLAVSAESPVAGTATITPTVVGPSLPSCRCAFMEGVSERCCCGGVELP